MKLQILLHSKDTDSVNGYEGPCDISNVLKDKKIRDVDDLKSIIKTTGFDSSHYMFLYRGYAIKSLKSDSESQNQEGTILAVPKDPLVCVLLPMGKEWKSSIGSFEGTVGHLKELLETHCLPVVPMSNFLLLDPFGQILNDDDSLSTVGSFDDQNGLQVIYKAQLKGYQVAEPSVRFSQSLKEALEAQKKWSFVGDLKTECDQASKRLDLSFKTAVNDLGSTVTPKTVFNSLRFHQFCNDFPEETSALICESTSLIDVKSRTIASANSICPNLVHRIIDAFISNKPNKVLTDTAAIIFGLLSKPITDISQKYPLEHNHQQACNQLKQVEAALVNYRLIMEMEMLYKQEDAEKRKQAIPVLEKEMHKINEHFPALIAEWNKANTWADLSCFANVDRVNLEPAAQSVDALVKDAKQQVKDERDRLDKLHEIDKDAKDFNSLIQDQVAWCQDVVRTAATAVDSDISDIRKQIEELMKVLAGKLVLKSHLEQRGSDLEELGKSQAKSFADFEDAYKQKETVISERLRQAETGRTAAEEFQQGMAELQEAIRAEIDGLRTKAGELKTDVAADCVFAYKLGCNIDGIAKQYTEIEKKGNEEDVLENQKHYRIALFKKQQEKADSLKDKGDKLQQDVALCRQKIAELEVHTAGLDRDVAAPWEYLCTQAGAAASAKQIRVRTSSANGEAWGGRGMDRELERPDMWNEEMRAKSEILASGGCIGN